jgi:hypothetical protein
MFDLLKSKIDMVNFLPCQQHFLNISSRHNLMTSNTFSSAAWIA